jgi:hypothetical protein
MVMTAADPRARDPLGRPLTRGTAGVDHGVDVDAARTASDALHTAQRLLDTGFPFAAHEVLEARWKQGPVSERAVWQGLAQVCVAITHQARGNAVGAHRLLERARMTLADAGEGAWHSVGIDRPGIDAWISDMLEADDEGDAGTQPFSAIKLLGT